MTRLAHLPFALLTPLALSLGCSEAPSPADGSGSSTTASSTDAPTGDTIDPDGSTAATETGSSSDDGTTTTTTQATGDTTDTADTGDTTDTGSPGVCGDAHEIPYALEFSTYYGGSQWEHTRDVFIDAAGNIYAAGGTASNDLPTTAGAYDTSFNTGGTQIGGHGPSDGWVAMFSPDGQLVWATYLGGPNYDRIYALEVADDGHVYVSGRSGPGFPVTPGVFQPEYLATGSPADFYGVQNGFVAKLSPDGSELVWSSQLGVNALVRDFDIDAQGNVYAALTYTAGVSGNTNPAWFAGAFDDAYQPTRNAGSESGLVKVSSDGTSVLWATWLGGNGGESSIGSVRVDEQDRPHLAFYTDSTDLPTTLGVVGSSHGGGQDVFVVRLSADGSALELGTYIGGSGDDAFETHAIGLAPTGEIVVAGFTGSDDFPVSAGAFQTVYGGGNIDAFAVRLDAAGALLAGTYVGGSGFEATDGLSVSATGEIAFVGETDSTDFPTTAGAIQGASGGDVDVFVVRLGPDFSALRFASYLGGGAHDNGRAAFMADDCMLLVAGASAGPGWPTLDAYQPQFAGGGQNWGNGDNILAKLVVAAP
jgi:hypothetical protein